MGSEEGPETNEPMRKRRFTLIELILVMTTLATVMAIAAPSLARFLRGRSVNQDARRLASLVRYARSQAISRSEPMEVWIEPTEGAYGLRAMHGHEDTGEGVLRFNLAEHVGVDGESLTTAPEAGIRIVYWPDGLADPDSAASVVLYNRNDTTESITISRPDTSPWYTIEE